MLCIKDSKRNICFNRIDKVFIILNEILDDSFQIYFFSRVKPLRIRKTEEICNIYK